MRSLIFSLLAVAALAPGQGGQTFTGTITDSMCPDADHAHMQMGATDAECAIACLDAHGAAFVLYDGTTTFALTDQQAPERLAGRKVIVTGTLDAATRTIRVTSISAAH